MPILLTLTCPSMISMYRSIYENIICLLSYIFHSQLLNPIIFAVNRTPTNIP